VPFRTWSVNGKLMLLQLGIGFDGRLMWQTPRRWKRAFGFLGVVMSALWQGITFDHPPLRVTGELADGGRLDADATSVMVANAKRWAGPRLTVPTADPGDDVVDVLVLTHRSFAQLARFWISILLPGSTHLALPFVRHARCRRVEVRALARPVEAHIDGEPAVTTPIVVEPLGRVTLLGLP